MGQGQRSQYPSPECL